MRISKPYTRLPLTEPEFRRLHGAVLEQIRTAAEKRNVARLRPTVDEKEVAFYVALINEYEAILPKFDSVLQADTSQDAEPDDDDEDEEKDEEED